MDKLNKFKECLELYLSKDLNIDDKENKTFECLKEKIKMPKEKNDKYKLLIKNYWRSYIIELTLTLISQFFELSKQVFYQCYGKVVERLKEDKKIQLTYIEYFIKYIINSNEDSRDEMNDVKCILDRNISLLCELYFTIRLSQL